MYAADYVEGNYMLCGIFIMGQAIELAFILDNVFLPVVLS